MKNTRFNCEFLTTYSNLHYHTFGWYIKVTNILAYGRDKDKDPPKGQRWFDTHLCLFSWYGHAPQIDSSTKSKSWFLQGESSQDCLWGWQPSKANDTHWWTGLWRLICTMGSCIGDQASGEECWFSDNVWFTQGRVQTFWDLRQKC